MTGRLLECVASVMFPNENEAFETDEYSTNAPTKRVRERSSPLPVDKGIISFAFRDDQAVTWCKKEANTGFEEIRDNTEFFYKSGVVCPVVSGGRAAAVLNIDCQEHDRFHDLERSIGMHFCSLLSCLFEAAESRIETLSSAGNAEQEL